MTDSGRNNFQLFISIIHKQRAFLHQVFGTETRIFLALAIERKISGIKQA